MDHLLLHVVWLVAAGLAVWLPGVAIERRWVRCPSADLRWLARWILGLGGWTAALFVLAIVQAFHHAAFTLLAVVGLLAGAVAWRAARLDVATDVAEASSPAEDRLVVGLLGASLAALLAPAWLLALGPTVSWDASAYHLSLPQLYLDHGGFRTVDMNVYSVWPLGTDLLFAPALAAGGPELAKLVHFGFGVLVLVALWRCAGLLAGWVAAILFLLNGVVLFEIRVAYIDLSHALYLLAAVLFTDRARRRDEPDDEHRRWLLLGGLSAALLASVKVTGIASVGLVFLAMIGPWIVDRIRRRGLVPALRETVPSLLPWAVPAAAAWLAWLTRSTWLTGNPFYPFLHGVFGGADWSPALGEALTHWQRGIGMGREPLDYLLLPLRVILAGGRGYERFDGELGAFWLIAVPIAIWGARRSPLARHALVVAGLHFVFWAASAQQSRFLIPCLGLLALATGLALRPLTERLDRRQGRLAAVGLAVVAATAFVSTEAELVRSGAQHLRLYLDPSIDLDERKPYPPVFDAVDALPLDAKLLMLNSNQRFFSRREVLADSFFEASQIAHWLAPARNADEVRGLLATRGVSHILLDRRPRGARYPEPLLDLLRDPSRVESIHQDQGFVLLALR